MWVWFTWSRWNNTKSVDGNAKQRNWNIPLLFISKFPCMGQHFKHDCMQAVGCSESLYYIETAMDIPDSIDCCTCCNIFNFFSICQVRIKGNKHSVSYQKWLNRKSGFTNSLLPVEWPLVISLVFCTFFNGNLCNVSIL